MRDREDPWAMGTKRRDVARVRHFEFVWYSQTLAVSIEKPLINFLLLDDKRIFKERYDNILNDNLGHF